MDCAACSRCRNVFHANQIRRDLPLRRYSRVVYPYYPVRSLVLFLVARRSFDPKTTPRWPKSDEARATAISPSRVAPAKGQTKREPPFNVSKCNTTAMWFEVVFTNDDLWQDKVLVWKITRGEKKVVLEMHGSQSVAVSDVNSGWDYDCIKPIRRKNEGLYHHKFSPCLTIIVRGPFITTCIFVYILPSYITICTDMTASFGTLDTHEEALQYTNVGIKVDLWPHKGHHSLTNPCIPNPTRRLPALYLAIRGTWVHFRRQSCPSISPLLSLDIRSEGGTWPKYNSIYSIVQIRIMETIIF